MVVALLLITLFDNLQKNSPSISSDVEDECFDDSHTPVIPVVAIEEAAEMDFQFETTAALNIFTNSQPAKLHQSPSPSDMFYVPQSKSLLSPEPSNNEKSDVTPLQDLGGPIGAAAAAATAIMKSKEPGSLIDAELLIKLLSNPKMTEKLVNEWGVASNTTSGTSGLEIVELSVPHPSSKTSFLIEKSTMDSRKPANPTAEAIHRPSRVKDSPVTPSRTGANVATTEIGLTSSQKQVEQSVHFLSSTPVPLVQKFTSRNIQPGSAGNGALLRPGNQPLAANAEIRTRLGPKQVTTSIPLPSSMSDLSSQKSFTVHCQTADAANMCVLEAADALSISTPDVLLKKSTGKHILLADDGHVAVPWPLQRAPATSIETGTGPRSKTVAPSVAVPSSNSDSQSRKFMKEHSQLANLRDVSLPSHVKPTLPASFRAGTCFGPKRVTPSVALPSALSDFSEKSTREHGPFLDTSFPDSMIEKQPHSFPRMQAEFMVDQLDIAHEAALHTTSPLFGPLEVPKSVLAMESHSRISRLKKLINEHGHVDGIPAPSKPDVENMKKLVKDYGSPVNLENSVSGAEHPSFPLPTLFSGMVEPLRANFQSAELLPTSSRASVFSTTTTSVSLPKDINYWKSLIKQHGKKGSQDDELPQYGIPHHYLQSKETNQKYKNSCKFYNSSKGCRNGSSCPYQHDLPERGRFGGIVLEAHGAKRMKLGGSLQENTSIML